MAAKGTAINETMEDQMLETSTVTMVNSSFQNIKEAPFSSKKPRIFPWEDLREVHPLIKTLLSSSSPGPLEKHPVAGRLVFFRNAWGQLTQDPNLLNIVEGYKIDFKREPKQKKVPKQIPMTKDQKSLVGREKGNAGKRSYPKSKADRRTIPKQHFLSQEKGRTKSPSHKFKEIKQILTISTFQNGGASLPKIPFGPGQFPLQNRPAGCIFLYSSQQKVNEIFKVLMGGEPIRICVPLLRFSLRPTDIYQAIKSPYCLAKGILP